MQQEHDFLARLAELAQSIPGGELAFTIALFIIVLSILVFVHEWGHYLAARSVGIKVQAFAIGFGRPILSWVDSAQTRWQVGWIPLGGYVQMLGQEDLKATRASREEGHFMAKSVGQRAWVIVAGPLANLVFGFLLLIVIMLTGEHKLKAEVGQVLPDMPAAGILQVGDVVRAANGQPIEDWPAMLEVISANGAQPLRLEVLRGVSEAEKEVVVVEIVPVVKTFTDLLGDTHTVGRIGVAPSYATFVVQHGPLDALREAGWKTWELTALTVKSLYKLMIGAVSADNLTGPLGIANLTGQTASSGMFALMMFMVVISINLCIVNLFPLPILDGGHLVMLAYEKISGRPLGAVAQEWLFKAGLACILALVGFATFNDVKRLGLLGGEQAKAQVEAVGSAGQAAGAAEVGK